MYEWPLRFMDEGREQENFWIYRKAKKGIEGKGVLILIDPEPKLDKGRQEDMEVTESEE